MDVYFYNTPTTTGTMTVGFDRPILYVDISTGVFFEQSRLNVQPESRDKRSAGRGHTE